MNDTAAMITADHARARLLELLVQWSYHRADDERFELTSGKKSNFYIDCKATTMRGEALPLIGRLVADRLPAGVDGIGGLTMGADAIALATAFWCATAQRPVNAFTVRKTAKGHGMMKFIEGCPGATVAVVDDVVTTGGSTIDAVERCREAGIHVAAVIVLVDRQEGGMENVRAAAGATVPVASLFTRADLERRWQDARARASAAAAP